MSEIALNFKDRKEIDHSLEKIILEILEKA
jgi:hypothetical protein